MKEHHNSENITEIWQYSIDDKPDLLISNLRLISDLIKNDAMKKSNFQKVIKTYSETGKIDIPKTSELIDGKRKILGYHVIGSGFDPIEMQIKENILDLNEFDKEIWKNEFMVPKHIKVVETSKDETSTQLFKNQNKFIQHSVIKRVKRITKAAGKRSSDIYEFLQKESNSKEKIEVEKKNSKYEMRLNPEIYISKKIGSKYVNPIFKKLVAKLGTNYDDEKVYKQYKEIIEKFGSQFIIGTEIGNTIRNDIYFKKDLLKKYSAEQLKSEAALFFEKNGKSNDWFTNNIESKLVFEGKLNDPEALRFDILPISILIECPIKAKFMNLAIEEFNQQFAETNPLDENKIYTQDEIEEKFTIKI